MSLWTIWALMACSGAVTRSQFWYKPVILHWLYCRFKLDYMSHNHFIRRRPTYQDVIALWVTSTHFLYWGLKGPSYSVLVWNIIQKICMAICVGEVIVRRSWNEGPVLHRKSAFVEVVRVFLLPTTFRVAREASRSAAHVINVIWKAEGSLPMYRFEVQMQSGH